MVTTDSTVYGGRDRHGGQADRRLGSPRHAVRASATPRGVPSPSRPSPGAAFEFRARTNGSIGCLPLVHVFLMVGMVRHKASLSSLGIQPWSCPKRRAFSRNETRSASAGLRMV